MGRPWIRSRALRCLAAALILTSPILFDRFAMAQKERGATGEEQDRQAMEALMRMSRYLAGLEHFGVKVCSSYDAIQEGGERIEFGEVRRIRIQRPDWARIEVERSDGDRGLLFFNGEKITAFKAGDNVYATVEKKGTVDGAIVFMVRDLQLTLPLARMFLTTLPQEMEKRVESVSFVETETLFDVPVDHLAARTADVDFQVWVPRGEQPLPRRVVITYRDIPGQPQFRANLSEWNIDPQVAADGFAFVPPVGAEKVPFLAPARDPSQAPPRKGGAK